MIWILKNLLKNLSPLLKGFCIYKIFLFGVSVANAIEENTSWIKDSHTTYNTEYGEVSKTKELISIVIEDTIKKVN